MREIIERTRAFLVDMLLTITVCKVKNDYLGSVSVFTVGSHHGKFNPVVAFKSKLY